MKLVMPQSIKQFLRLSLICLSLLSVTMVQAQSRGLPDFVDLAEKQSPSVVNISTVQNGRGKVTNGFPVDPTDARGYAASTARKPVAWLGLYYQRRRLCHDERPRDRGG